MKRGRGAGGLVPLSHFANRDAKEAARLKSLRRAWPLVVGPGMSRHTHPISIANGRLLIGCHDTSVLASLRASAESAWPTLRGRIDTMVGTHLQRVEVTPSDPPPEEQPPAAQAPDAGFDPLATILALRRTHKKDGGLGGRGPVQ